MGYIAYLGAGPYVTLSKNSKNYHIKLHSL